MCEMCETLRGPKYASMCDNCFVNLHRKKGHHWRPLVATCIECNNWAVKWWCNQCEEPYCTRCFAKLHRKGKRLRHTCDALPLFVMELKAKRDKEDDERHFAVERAKRARAREAFKHEQMVRAVTKFQAAYRAKVARRGGLEHMRMVRLWQRAESVKQRQFEENQKLASTKLKNLGKAAAMVLAEDQYALELPGTVTLKRGSKTMKTTVDLTAMLKKGDRIRVAGRRFTIRRVPKLPKDVSTDKGTALSAAELFKTESQKAIDRIQVSGPLGQGRWGRDGRVEGLRGGWDCRECSRTRPGAYAHLWPIDRAVSQAMKKQAEDRKVLLKLLLTEKWDGYGDFDSVREDCLERNAAGAVKKVRSVKAYKLPEQKGAAKVVAMASTMFVDGVKKRRRKIQGAAGDILKLKDGIMQSDTIAKYGCPCCACLFRRGVLRSHALHSAPCIKSTCGCGVSGTIPAAN